MTLLLLCLLVAPTADDLRAETRQAMRFWHVPGAAVAVVIDGKAFLAEGFGLRDILKKDPVTDTTLFCISSNSKSFASAALALLVEEGKLAWDDPVRKRLPGFRLADPEASRKATLRDLLCHRTGLAKSEFLWHESGFTPREVVLRAGLLPLAAPFRSTFQYDSPMVTAAGLATERAAGMPWGRFVEKRLLAPLDMKNTFTDSLAAGKRGNVAAPHVLDARDVPEGIDARPWPVSDAAGSIHTCARDMAKWMRFQLAGDPKVLSLKRLRETHVPNIGLVLQENEKPLFADTKKRGYAMGWVAYDHRGHALLAHGGSIDGMRCHVTLAPDKGIGVAVLSNLGHTQMNSALAIALMERLLGLEPRDWNALHLRSLRVVQAARREALEARKKARKKGTEPTLPLARYAGTYLNPAYGTLRIALQGGELALRWRGYKTWLSHWQDDEFTLDGGRLDGFPAFFKREAGTVRALRIEGRFPATFRRIGP